MIPLRLDKKALPSASRTAKVRSSGSPASTMSGSPSPAAKSTVPTVRKKRHTYGAYPCDYPDCNKIFQRSDHLSRHRLTHDRSSKNYVCSWPGCNKRFNRTDTMKLHYNRHQKNGTKGANDPVLKDQSPVFSGPEAHNDSNTELAQLKNSNNVSQLETPILQNVSMPSTTTGNRPISTGTSNFASIALQETAPQVQSSMYSKISSLLNSNMVQSEFTSPQPYPAHPDLSAMIAVPQDQLPPPHPPLPQQRQQPLPPPPSQQRQPSPSIPHEATPIQLQEEIASNAPYISAPYLVEAPEVAVKPGDMLNYFFTEDVELQNDHFNGKIFPELRSRNGDHDNNNDNRSNMDKDPNSFNAISATTSASTMGKYGSTSSVEQNSFNLFDPSQNMILEKLSSFPMSPGLFSPSTDSYIYVDAQVMQKLEAQLPQLAENPDFRAPLLQRTLQIYWGLYNCRISIIHKPSFDTRTAQPVLLLAMIMMGAALNRASEEIDNLFVNAQKLALDIAIPLRWVIFQLPELSSAKPWIIQSLIILESYEKHMSTRELFQRSTIHHLTKIQILRRSTTLGGDPYRKENFDAETLLYSHNKTSQLWSRWVELEAMKRCAYASFLNDSWNAVSVTQPVVLYAHQMKLSIPCGESLWYSQSFDKELLKNNDWKTESFLSLFTDMINERKFSETCSSAVNQSLLAGIMTLIFMFQNTTSLRYHSNTETENWRDTMTYCLESWLVNVKAGDCCTRSPTADFYLYNPEYQVISYWNYNDHRCKAPIYHLAHVTLRLSNFDWMTYSGSPLLMNVRADYSDFDAVSMRVANWSRSIEGGVSVVNAYLLLFECLLPRDGAEHEFIPYRPEKDIFIERPYCLAQLTVIIWCYNYSLKGPECGFLDNEMNFTYYMNDKSYIDSHIREDGYSYLRRIRLLFQSQDQIFEKYLKLEVEKGTLTPLKKTSLYHKKLQQYLKMLNRQLDAHHIAGLMLTMSELMGNCDLEICIEISKLLKHCQSRSMGNKEIKCMNMYV